MSTLASALTEVVEPGAYADPDVPVKPRPAPTLRCRTSVGDTDAPTDPPKLDVPLPKPVVVSPTGMVIPTENPKLGDKGPSNLCHTPTSIGRSRMPEVTKRPVESVARAMVGLVERVIERRKEYSIIVATACDELPLRKLAPPPEIPNAKAGCDWAFAELSGLVPLPGTCAERELTDAQNTEASAVAAKMFIVARTRVGCASLMVSANRRFHFSRRTKRPHAPGVLSASSLSAR